MGKGRFALAAAATIALAACGSGNESGGNAEPSEQPSATARTLADGWAEDACRTFGAAQAGKAAGVPLTQAKLDHSSNSGPAAMSTCSYRTADEAAYFTLLLRQDTTGQETVDSQIKGLAAEPDMTGPMTPVAMPVGKALWASRLKTLSYVPDNARMIVVTPPNALGANADAEETLKQRAVAIASAVPL